MRYLFLYCFSALIACQPSKLTVQEMAKPANLPVGAPKYSDVCFSSRWERPRDAKDSLETFSAARSFHATWLNWVYTTNPGFIRKADSLGYKVQVALSPTLPDYGNTTYSQGRMINKTGELVTAPWMKTWNHWWGCVNHPDFQAAYLAYLKSALEAGAHSIQVDDAAMGYLLVRNQWEDVCHCRYCLEKARLENVPTAAIQERAVREFHEQMFAEADKLAGKHVPFSSNNFDGDWKLFPANSFDFGTAELPERRANPEYIYAALREARKLGKAQVFTFAMQRDWMTQKMIAATYASGGNPLVPWDVWREGKERYFGKPADFAPLYGFVRANAQYLDGYEDAFFTTTQTDLRFTKKENLPVSFLENSGQIFAYVRAKPNDPNSPVVVHLIDWYVLMDSFKVLLNEKRFFKNGIQRIELLTPIPYQLDDHEKAAASGDFSPLVKRITIPFERDGKFLHLKIPKLAHHWGILVVDGG